jgi:hypothetical protein
VFGLHANAEIQYFNNAAKSLWAWVLDMQTSEGGDAGGTNREEYIIKVQEDISAKIPRDFDMMVLKKQFEEPSPT